MSRFSNDYPADWPSLAKLVKDEAEWKCIRCGHIHEVATGYVLTVHHFVGDKALCERWNLMALCQRCHLSVQARVDPRRPIMFDPSVWSMPYIAGSMPYIAGVYAAGICQAPESYDLSRWIAEYEASGRVWPTWAETPKASVGNA